MTLNQQPGCEIRILVRQPSDEQLDELEIALADLLVSRGFDNQSGLDCVITLGPYEWPRDTEAAAREYMEGGWRFLLPGAADVEDDDAP
jgi:hypothetical protein